MKPYVMSKQVLSKLAKSGRYPFCHTCGTAIEVGVKVHPFAVKYPNGGYSVKYFCDTCESTGRMYAVG
jgi:predicted RNA-binding Zn-ribbon protein involved in translation (DUF1610 family)